MKTLILTFALAVGAAGCLGAYVPAEPTGGGGGADMAHATGTGGNGTGTGGGTGSGNGSGNGSGSGGSTDMAMTSTGGATDGGVVAGVKAFGDLCTVDGDCQSGMCRQFVMGTVHRCTKACDPATATTDCPNPPSAGSCTNAVPAYCKFTN